jgi:hypothetical protein
LKILYKLPPLAWKTSGGFLFLILENNSIQENKMKNNSHSTTHLISIIIALIVGALLLGMVIPILNSVKASASIQSLNSTTAQISETIQMGDVHSISNAVKQLGSGYRVYVPADGSYNTDADNTAVKITDLKSGKSSIAGTSPERNSVHDWTDINSVREFQITN